MLVWALILFVVAFVAGVFGFGHWALSDNDVTFAQVLFFLFIVLAITALYSDMMSKRRGG